jgi:hypothetical protein
VAADVWVYGDGVDEAFLVLAVEELEAVHPHFFDVPGVDPTVGVGGFFLFGRNAPLATPSRIKSSVRKHSEMITYNKHHRRQIVRVPTRGNLTQSSCDACFERFHPVVRVLAVVDRDPLVACA